VVREGWLVNNHGRGLFWRDELNKQIAALGRPDEFDLTKLVFSADTEKRCLRIVVPRKGVQNVRIEHRDECGALKELTDALYHAEFNVLSSLLKRGGAAMDNAVLVAICEPVSMGVPDAVLREKISKEVANIDPKYRAELKITEGHSCYSVLDARRQGDLVIRVPELLRPRVDAIREKLDPSRIAIFLSYRFYNARAKLYMDEVKKVLAETGCQVVESPIRGRAVDLHSAFEDVSAAMWASDAVIVLVAAPEDDRSAISLNLAHEFGFFQGNGKPILWLVEKNPVVDADFNKFTNLQGLAKPSFSHESFDDNNHQDSIPSQIKKWLQEINAIRSLSHSHNSVIS
jgi:hypothetical protein